MPTHVSVCLRLSLPVSVLFPFLFLSWFIDIYGKRSSDTKIHFCLNRTSRHSIFVVKELPRITRYFSYNKRNLLCQFTSAGKKNWNMDVMVNCFKETHSNCFGTLGWSGSCVMALVSVSIWINCLGHIINHQCGAGYRGGGGGGVSVRELDLMGKCRVKLN